MNDQPKTNNQLLKEIDALKSRISELEKSEIKCKQEADALRKNEIIIQNILDASPDVMHLIDINGIILASNKSFFKKLGLKIEEVIGKSVYDFPPAESARKRKIAIDKVFKTGEPVQLEDIGRTGVFESIVQPVFNSSGKVTSVAVYAKDITERIQTDDKLSEHKANLTALIENTKALVWSVNKDYRLITANSPFIKFVEPLYGKMIKPGHLLIDEEILPTEILKKWRTTYDRVLLGEQFSIELSSTVSNKQKYLEVSFNPIYEGNKIIGISAFGRDISERIQTEKKLLKNKYYLTKAQEIGLIGTWELDLQKNILTWTEENYKIFGVPVGTEMNYELFLNCVHPDDWDYVNEQWSGAVRNKTPYDIEHRLLVNGKVKWVREKADIEYDSTGNPVSAIGFTQDINERKQSEKELHESVEKYRVIFNDHSAVKLIINPGTGIIEDANKAAAKFYGWSCEELKTMNISQINTLSPDEIQIELTLAKKREKGYFEFKHKKVDGTIVDVEVYSSNISIDGKVYLHSIIHDISDKKLAEKALKQSEEKYRTFFENNDAIILFINPDNGNISFSNKAAANYYGYTREQLINMNINEINTLPPEEIKAKTADARIRKQNYFLLKHKLANGEIRDVEVYQTKLQFNNQDIFSIIVHDITERKQAEIAQKESEEKYKALFDNAPLSYQSLNKDGSFKDVNPAWLRTLGYSRDEVIGKYYKDFLHPDWKAHFEKNFPEFKRRGYVNDVQFKIRHKNGNYLDISFEGCIGYHPDGSFKQTYCVFQDITQRKQTEIALLESETRFKSIFSEAPVGIEIFDSKGSLINANQECLNIFGVDDVQEIKGFKLFEDPNLSNEAKSQVKEGKPYRYETEFDFELVKKHKLYNTSKSGKCFLNILITPYEISSLNEHGYLVHVVDITERMKAEIGISRYNRIFEESLNEIFLFNANSY